MSEQQDTNDGDGVFYAIELLDAAEKDINALPKKVQAQLLERIEKLAFDPRPQASTPLVQYKGLRRLRSGNYRIIYRIDDDVLEILVVAVGDRQNIFEIAARRIS